jgi:hypothetical protein
MRWIFTFRLSIVQIGIEDFSLASNSLATSAYSTSWIQGPSRVVGMKRGRERCCLLFTPALKLLRKV